MSGRVAIFDTDPRLTAAHVQPLRATLCALLKFSLCQRPAYLRSAAVIFDPAEPAWSRMIDPRSARIRTAEKQSETSRTSA